MRRSRRIPAALAIVAAIAAWSPAAAGAARQFTYRVQMAPYGTIGVYRSAVQRDGRETTITTEAHIRISLIGIVLYRMDISRVERRIGDRLVYFHGLTTENGNPVQVDGRAVGEHFIITSPAGSITAPGTIRVSDPWSAAVPGPGIVFMPDTGVVARVQTSGGEQTSIIVNGAAIRVTCYRVNTNDDREQYELWMDDQRTPVMFKITDRQGTTTFTLVRSGAGN